MERRASVYLVMAGLATGAAAVHFAMVPQHANASLWEGVGFGVVAWLQIALAIALVVRPSTTVVRAGSLGMVAVLGVYAASRTVGLPVGAHAGDAEAVSAIDLLTAGMEALFVVLAVAAPRLERVRVRSALVSAASLAGVAALTTAALASPSATHHATGGHADDRADPAHEHAAGEHVAHEEHGHEEAEHEEAGVLGHNAEACTAEVTPAQQASADALVAESRGELARFSDLAVAEADGYVQYQVAGRGSSHYVNPAYATDGEVLDPARPESLVYVPLPDGRRVLIGAMFLNDSPETDPPQPGGCATVWHGHEGVCSAPGRLDVPDASGNCPAGTSAGGTTDMLHVWLIDLPGGPFTDSLDPAEVRAALLDAART